jgi:hypothetical protein
MAVLRIGGLLEDQGTGFPRALKMFVDALHIDVQALRGLAKALRIAITGRGTPHHNQILAKLHGGVIDLTVRSAHLDAVLAESKCLGQEPQSAANVFVIKIWRDDHKFALLSLIPCPHDYKQAMTRNQRLA